MLRRAFRYHLRGALEALPCVGLEFNLIFWFRVSHMSPKMIDDAPSIQLGKIDVARRHLQTAINLWFAGGEPVSIHLLAYSAYEIIHAISKKRNPGRTELIFDSKVTEEQRAEFNIWLKSHANFFKHANKDGDAVIDFQPALSELFLFFACYGLAQCGEAANKEELAIMYWFMIHKPHLLTDTGAKFFAEKIPIVSLEHIRSLDKREFLEAYYYVLARGD